MLAGMHRFINRPQSISNNNNPDCLAGSTDGIEIETTPEHMNLVSGDPACSNWTRKYENCALHSHQNTNIDKSLTEEIMITVWGRASSSNVQVVLWCLQELDLEYTRIDAGFTYGVTDTADYLAMNPNGVVPTIQDGDNSPMFESCAILRYLSSRYGSNEFWPVDLADRGTVDMWAEWSKLNVAQLFSQPLFWPTVRLPPSASNPEAITAACKALNKNLKIADNRLASSTYLVSDNFTMADVVFGHILYRYFDIDIPRAEFSNIARYYEMLQSRTAYRNNVMVSYDELRYSPET